MNPKIGEPVMQSLSEGLKFVFNNKTVLGAITLDMVAFWRSSSYLPFCSRHPEVGPEGWLSKSCSGSWCFTMLITAYVPLSKNAGMKLLSAIFAFGICIVFGLSTIFWVSLLLIPCGVFDGISVVVIRQTILQLKTPDHMRGRFRQ
jgi:hypothetical protein